VRRGFDGASLGLFIVLVVGFLGSMGFLEQGFDDGFNVFLMRRWWLV
jgi:hypothetical protein